MAAVTRLPVAVVAATMVVSGCGAGRAGPLPADTLAQIRAEYGPRAYVPGFVPLGFIFTSWRIDPAQYEYLAPVLQITFGESGKLLAVDGLRQRRLAPSDRLYCRGVHEAPTPPLEQMG